MNFFSRLQLFHVIKKAKVGGENMISDGFNVAEEFQRHYPEGFEFFSSLVMENEYIHTTFEPYEHALGR